MLNRRRRRRRVVVVGEERALGWGSGEGHTTAEHSTQWICTGVAMWLLASIYKRRRRREEEQTGVACKGLFEIIFLFIISYFSPFANSSSLRVGKWAGFGAT
jgi:hypothetical protein